MRRIAITIAATVATLVGSSAAATAEQPASDQASCVAVITSYEASQLAAGSVGAEVSGLASTPGLGSALVSPLAKTHLGSIGRAPQPSDDPSGGGR
jgi:hypothetical protein